MKNGIKKSFSLLLALVLIFSLAACGGKPATLQEVGTYKLYEIMYDGETMDNETIALLGVDKLCSLELKEDGTGSIVIDEEAQITWGNGKITNTEANESYNYSYDNGKLTLEDETGAIVFLKNESAGKVADSSGNSGKASLKAPTKQKNDAPQTEIGQYWSGDWYGWWQIEAATGYWEDTEANWYDCCARITMDSDSAGYIEIWDEDGSANVTMAECAVSFGAGTTSAGAMMSEDGFFWDTDLLHADWIVDPGASRVSDFDHIICINGHYDDPVNEGGFDYYIYLRPWGMDWADLEAVDENNLPSSYEWYMAAIDAGQPMPDTIGD